MWILKIRVWELFTHGEGISTPRVRHKGRQPLIQCAQRDFRIIYFSIFIFFFWGRQGCCPCSYVSSGAMRNLDLRSSLSLNVCVLNWFFMFLKDSFYLRTKSHLRCWTLKRFLNFEKQRESLRRWTLKRSFKFEKRRESLRHWTLKRSQVIFDKKK